MADKHEQENLKRRRAIESGILPSADGKPFDINKEMPQ
jgi:hypothetical protein